MNVYKLMLAAVLGVLLAACSKGMTVTVTFEDAGPVEVGTPVYLGEVKIGEVAGSTVTGDLMEAELSLDPDLSTGLNAGSAALLDSFDGKPAILVYNYRPGDEPLESGGELIGLHDAFELTAWRAGEALDTGRQSVEEMTKSVKKYFESDEWQQQKEKMNRQMEELKSTLGETYDETNRAYQEFLEDLESKSDEARERARESYSELAEQLRMDIDRLKKNGNEKLVQPLLKLLDELSQAMRKKPEQDSA